LCPIITIITRLLREKILKELQINSKLRQNLTCFINFQRVVLKFFVEVIDGGGSTDGV